MGTAALPLGAPISLGRQSHQKINYNVSYHETEQSAPQKQEGGRKSPRGRESGKASKEVMCELGFEG